MGTKTPLATPTAYQNATLITRGAQKHTKLDNNRKKASFMMAKKMERASILSLAKDA